MLGILPFQALGSLEPSDEFCDTRSGVCETVVSCNFTSSSLPFPFIQIKNHCWIFVNCLIENPTFDSQTKENMTLVAKKFGSTCSLSEKFLKSVSSSGC